MSFTTRQRAITIIIALILISIILHLRPSYRSQDILPSLGTNDSKLFLSWTSHHEFVESKTLESPDTAVITDELRATFDIIVSLYKEDINNVIASLSDLQSLPVLQNYRRVRVFVYVKDEEAQVAELRKALNVSRVIQIPNRGRETGTYLSHILANWNDLATHNMFIQAHMHRYDDAKNRLSDYLSPNTGVLNLGSYELCDCLACKDPWDGERTFPRLEQLYSLVNRKFCPPRVALSYLGQIVTSKKRIHSQPLEIYQYIKDVLESDLSNPIHSDPRQAIFEDSITNPYFGHTMERSYMVLWGCGDPSIVETCGSGFDALANRRGPMDADDKCQCLDL